MSSEAGQTLSHYRLVEKIGEGGMGVVWKAEDTVLNRTVAIKVLPADRARDDERRRMFLDEARRASSVNDMHIVQVYELGREGDLDFIVMEYVDGKPLNRLLHHKPLPPETVASIGHQVAKALARAHRQGLLHRDLKPANILVTADGDAKVVDFGLATLFEPGRSLAGTESSTLSVADTPAAGGGGARTGRGPLAGTLPYMSPEQARGESLDPRSDIFSLGSVLYEMTTGQRPFTGPTSVDVLQAIIRARPAPVHEQVPSVPIELERIIQKALTGHRAERYQSMEDLAVDLKRLGRDLETGSSPSFDALREPLRKAQRRRMALMVGAAALALAVVGIGAWLMAPRLSTWFGAPAADAKTILILPMEVRGQVEGAEYVGRAFAEAIAVSLAVSKDLKVLPVPAAGPEGTAARANPLTSSRAALDLGAGRLLTGSLTREAKAVHASLNLVDTSQNRILWGARRDGDDDRLPDMATSLARDVAVQVGAMLLKEYDTALNSLGGPTMASSPLMTEALAALQSHEASAALAATKRLIEAFAGEPEAWHLRAEALFNAWNIERIDPNRMALEEGLADLARADPKHPAVEIMQAYLISSYGLGAEAFPRLTQVLARQDLAPALRARALTYRGWNRYEAGEYAAALADLEEALRLSPASAETYRALADALRYAGRLEEALVRARQAVALSPLNWLILLTLNWTLTDLGKPAEAVPYAARACALSANGASCASYATTLQRAGRSEDAIQAARKAEDMPEDSMLRYNLACFYAVAGRPREALRNLRRSVDLGYTAAFIGTDPDLASLQGDPEYQAIVTDVKRRLGR